MIKKLAAFLLAFAVSFGVGFYFFDSGTALISYADSKTSDFSERIYPYQFGRLSPKRQAYYEIISDALRNCEESVLINNEANNADFQIILDILCYNDPLFFHFENASSEKAMTGYKLSFEYYITLDEYNFKLDKINERAEQIISGIPQGATPYDKVKYFHDTIVENCVYDLDAPDSDNPYGALVNGRAKCDGYSRAFSYLCSLAGIPSVMVVGTEKSLNSGHMWNKVKMGNEWYNIDLTYGDPVSYFKDNVTYRYYMVDDAVLSRTHTEFKMSFESPRAVNGNNSYFKLNGLYAKSVAEAERSLLKSLKGAAESGETFVAVQFPSDAEYKKAVQSLITEDGFSELIKKTNKSRPETSLKICEDIYFRIHHPETRTLRFVIFYPNTSLSDYFSDISDISKKDIARLNSNGIK